MTTDYRAFGECQKTILGAGQSIDLTTLPPAYSAGLVPANLSAASGYKFMHVLPLVSSQVTVKLAFDLQAANAVTVTTTSQIVGVSSIAVVSGTVEVFLFL